MTAQTKRQGYELGQAASTAFQISGRAVLFGAKRSEFELTFADLVHEFDTGDGDRGNSEPLQPKHWAQAKIDRSIILFNEVIQVF